MYWWDLSLQTITLSFWGLLLCPKRALISVQETFLSLLIIVPGLPETSCYQLLRHVLNEGVNWKKSHFFLLRWVLLKKVPLMLFVLSRPDRGDVGVFLKLLFRNGWLMEDIFSLLVFPLLYPLLGALRPLRDILRPIWLIETLLRKSGRGTGLIECLLVLFIEFSEPSVTYNQRYDWIISRYYLLFL